MDQLPFSSASIQLSKEIRKVVDRRWASCQNSPLGKLHPSKPIEDILILPKKFRELRALVIGVWYLPEMLKWNLLISLSEMTYSLDFKTKGLEQSLLLKVCSSSEANMLYFVQETINPRELFGTILNEDLLSALRNLRLPGKQKKVRRKIRRKGYQDKGTWRPPHLWKPRFDKSFDDEQYDKEKRKLILEFLYYFYLYKLSKIER